MEFVTKREVLERMQLISHIPSGGRGPRTHESGTPWRFPCGWEVGINGATSAGLLPLRRWMVLRQVHVAIDPIECDRFAPGWPAVTGSC